MRLEQEQTEEAESSALKNFRREPPVPKPRFRGCLSIKLSWPASFRAQFFPFPSVQRSCSGLALGLQTHYGLSGTSITSPSCSHKLSFTSLASTISTTCLPVLASLRFTFVRDKSDEERRAERASILVRAWLKKPSFQESTRS